MSLPLVDVYRARRRIAPYVGRTPLVESPRLTNVAGAPTAALVTASAGNHGR